MVLVPRLLRSRSRSWSRSRSREAARLGSSGKALGREPRRGRWASAGAQRGGRGAGGGARSICSASASTSCAPPPPRVHSLQPPLHVSGYHAAAERVSGAAVPPRACVPSLGVSGRVLPSRGLCSLLPDIHLCPNASGHASGALEGGRSSAVCLSATISRPDRARGEEPTSLLVLRVITDSPSGTPEQRSQSRAKLSAITQAAPRGESPPRAHARTRTRGHTRMRTGARAESHRAGSSTVTWLRDRGPGLALVLLEGTGTSPGPSFLIREVGMMVLARPASEEGAGNTNQVPDGEGSTERESEAADAGPGLQEGTGGGGAAPAAAGGAAAARGPLLGGVCPRQAPSSGRGKASSHPPTPAHPPRCQRGR